MQLSATTRPDAWESAGGAVADPQVLDPGMGGHWASLELPVDPALRVTSISGPTAKTLPATSVHALVEAMAAFAPQAVGQIGLPPRAAAQLNPTLAANWQ